MPSAPSSAKANLAAGSYSVRAKNSDGQVSNVLSITVNAGAVSTGTVRVIVTMNGAAFSGTVACGFLNSASNVQINSVPFVQSSLPPGAYNLSCAAGPPKSQLQSISPGANQTLTSGRQ